MSCKHLPVLLLLLAAPLAAEEARIPECMLNYRFGPEQHMLVVEKSSHRLLVFSNYSTEPVDVFPVTTGRVVGQKREEGDQKTPEGIYFFDAILTGSQLPKSDDYGDKAFTLSYPNPYDRMGNRDGSGIWLHGAHDPDKTTVPNNSRGCVVLKNSDLMRISKYIFLRQTPICIYERIPYDTPETIKRRRDQFLGQLKLWKEAWESRDIEPYIAFFHPDYRYKEMDLAQFRRYKDELNRSYRFIRVFLRDVWLYGYGSARVARFDQLYVSDQNQFHGAKIQYWLENEGQLRILDESTQSLPPVERVEASAGNYLPVEEFRRQVLRGLQGGSESATASFRPAAIDLERLTLEPERVRIEVRASGLASGARLVPVLRLETEGRTDFRTLAGIELDNGLPRDFRAALPLSNGGNRFEMTKPRSAELRSVTLFVAPAEGEIRQISTYIVAPRPAGKE